MQIVYIEDCCFSKIEDKINWANFFKENKLVLLSKYPYLTVPHCMYPQIYRRLRKYNVHHAVMNIALGNLAYIEQNNKMEPLHYGPTFDEKDFVNFPLLYFQEREQKQVDCVSFHYRNFVPSLSFSFTKLQDYLNSLGLENNDFLTYQKVKGDFRIKQEIVSSKVSRKILFVASEQIVYGQGIERIKGILSTYLKAGHFLVLLTYTGAHFGYPFSINIGDVIDTSFFLQEYRELLSFFNSLDIEEDQVTNFKVSYTGINFKGGLYPFGFSHTNVNAFVSTFLEYLKNKGYLIDDVFLFDHTKNSFSIQNIDCITNRFVVPTQEDFDEMVRTKILK